MALNDLSRPVKITAFAFHLFEAARLPLDHGLGPGLARLELGAIRDAVAELACTLTNVGGWLTEHAPYFPSGLHGVETHIPCQCSRPVVGQSSKLAAR